MVYLHFPPGHTEEELMLQTKYEKLKRKKKAVQNLKTPSRNEPGDRHLVTGSHHHHHHHGGSHHQSHAAAAAHHTAVQQAAGSAAAKRARCEARDAREIARKLLKSGAIAAIQRTPRREQQAGGFKRPCGLERKLADERADRPVSGYQPFSATQPEDFNNVTTVGVHEPERPRIKKPFETPRPVSPVSSGARPFKSELTSPDRSGLGAVAAAAAEQRCSDSSPGDPPKEGNTVHVTTQQPQPARPDHHHHHHQKLNEEFLRRTFRTCGKIINVTTEAEKNCGFVTFDTKEAAAGAITEYNSCMVAGIQLKVAYSKRQPAVDAVNGAHSAAAWSSAASNNSQKGSYKETREKVDYSDNPFD